MKRKVVNLCVEEATVHNILVSMGFKVKSEERLVPTLLRFDKTIQLPCNSIMRPTTIPVSFEIDGAYHFFLQKQQERDRIKNQWCMHNKRYLLRLSCFVAVEQYSSFIYHFIKHTIPKHYPNGPFIWLLKKNSEYKYFLNPEKKNGTL